MVNNLAFISDGEFKQCKKYTLNSLKSKVRSTWDLSQKKIGQLVQTKISLRVNNLIQ